MGARVARGSQIGQFYAPTCSAEFRIGGTRERVPPTRASWFVVAPDRGVRAGFPPSAGA